MADWGSSIFSRADGTQETTIGNYGQKHNIKDGKTVGETRPQGNRGGAMASLLPSLHCQSAKEALWAKLQTGRDVCGMSANQNFHAILYLLT